MLAVDEECSVPHRLGWPPALLLLLVLLCLLDSKPGSRDAKHTTFTYHRLGLGATPPADLLPPLQLLRAPHPVCHLDASQRPLACAQQHLVPWQLGGRVAGIHWGEGELVFAHLCMQQQPPSQEPCCVTCCARLPVCALTGLDSAYRLLLGGPLTSQCVCPECCSQSRRHCWCT
jgi:hypothetical protein